MRNQSTSIRSRGSEELDRNRKTKTSGKMLCTASPEPVRSATSMPSEPKPRAVSTVSTDDHGGAGEPGRERRAGDVADQQERRCPARRRGTAMPAMWPSSSAAPCIGVSERRSRKPVRMSCARSVPAPPMAKRPRLQARHAEREGRGSRPSGSRAAASPPAGRRSSRRAGRAGRRRRRRPSPAGARCARSSAAPARRPASTARAARAAERRGSGAATALTPGPPPSASGASASPRPSDAPSRWRPVLARNTSSSVGACSCRSAIARPSPSSARMTSASAVGAVVELHGDRVRPGLRRRPKRSSTRDIAWRSSALHGTISSVGRAISAFSSSGVPSATMRPLVDDADAAGQDVGLLQVLRRQEDGHAVLAGEPRRPPPRARFGSADRGRWWARRGTARAGC